MNFASPFFFWGLLSLLPLIAVYFLKVRPARKPTTAYFLWEQIFQERRATTLFQRFRDIFSLLLLTGVFASIVTATAKPFWTGDDRKDLVLVIDNTASMNAKDGMSTRLESAKSIARSIVRALNGNQRCSVATIANETSYQSNLTDNPKELLDAIDRIQPTAFSFNPQAFDEFKMDAVDQNKTTAANNEQATATETDPNKSPHADHRVMFISDGVLASEIPAGVELLKVGGGSGGNIGIIACDLQRYPTNDDQAGLFFQVASTFTKTLNVDLSISYETPENLVKLVPLEINPGVNASEVVQIDGAKDGRWLIQLDIKDDLADDNRVFATLPPRVPIPVAVSATDRFFFENSVLAFSRSGNLLTLVEPAASNMIIANENISLDGLAPNVDLMIFHPIGESIWWQDVGEEFETALPRVLDEKHPVVRHLDIGNMAFIGARRLRSPAGSEIWAEAEDGTPLIYRATNAGRNAVIVNLDPMGGEFVLSPWFPVLVYSTATHLAGRTESLRSNYKTGAAVPILGFQDGQSSDWTDPQGQTAKISDANSAPLNQLGFYELKNKQGTWPIGASLLSATETNLENANVVDSSKPVSRGLSPIGWLTLLALIVVVIESIFYQRRWVG